MLITILCPGKMKEAWMREAQSDYVKRLSRYAQVNIVELNDAPDSLSLEEALNAEAEQIKKKLPERAFIMALDIQGKSMDSPAFAELMQRAFEQGGSRVCILIGGSRGLAPELLQRADIRVSFSKLTFTHLMARILLLEQIYRGFKIVHNEPYHK